MLTLGIILLLLFRKAHQVLKDAVSCAIYGVRGANGVIVVTTKKVR